MRHIFTLALESLEANRKSSRQSPREAFETVREGARRRSQWSKRPGALPIRLFHNHRHDLSEPHHMWSDLQANTATLR